MICKFQTEEKMEKDKYYLADLEASLKEAMDTLREAVEEDSISKDTLRKVWRLLDKWENV